MKRKGNGWPRRNRASPSQQKQQQPGSIGVPAGSVQLTALLWSPASTLTFTPATVGAWLRTCGISTAKAEVVDRQATIAACFSIKLQSGVPRRASNSDQHVRPKPAHDSDCGRPKSNLIFRPKFRPKHVRPKPYGRSPLSQGKWWSDRDAAKPIRRSNHGVTETDGSAVLQGH